MTELNKLKQVQAYTKNNEVIGKIKICNKETRLATIMSATKCKQHTNLSNKF